MIKKFALLGLTAALLSGVAPAYAVNFALVAELSGVGAAAGTPWKYGAEMAVEEINAAGGILGEQINLISYDTQTDPQTSRALVQKAADDDAYVILGTVFSGSTVVNMIVSAQNEIPQFTGSEAPSITNMGNEYIFRTSFGAQKSMPKIVAYLRNDLKLDRVAVSWINNEFGKGGRDEFIAEAKSVGLEVVADVPSEAGQADFAADVVKLKNANAQAIFAYHTEEESARLIMEIRKQGVDLPIIGETTLISAKVIDLAGGAVNGVLGHVGLSADVPIEAITEFSEKYEAKYNQTPDHNSLKSYIITYAIKYATEQVGEFDRVKLAEKMHGLTITTADEPNVFMDLGWDETGELSRESFLVEVVDGKQVVTATLPAL